MTTMTGKMWSVLAIILNICVSAIVAAEGKNHGEALVSWLRSKKGGFFHPSLEIRRYNPEDSTSSFGMFATADISAKEPLITIPREALITAEGTENDCDTVRNLVRELRLGSESKYAPYVDYLLEQPVGQLPSAWSAAGQKLLQDMLGPRLPPDDPTDFDFRKDCESNENYDALVEHAYMMLLQRGWDDVLIPVYDMMSHRNGPALNTESDTVHDVTKPVRVRSSRAIRAGEEISTSYNFCEDCGNRATQYGTPEIVRDYGFVEQYPQRWIFHKWPYLAFELIERGGGGDNNEDEDDRVQFSWLFAQPPQYEAIEFLMRQKDRLVEFAKEELAEYNDEIPKTEWDVIVQYKDAALNAMTLAIITAQKDQECAATPADPQACETPILNIKKEKIKKRKKTRYDALQEHEDRLDYSLYTCQQGRSMKFPHYIQTDKIKSLYQDIEFYTHEEHKDTCFELDNIVQICGSYRPHYHEKAVHYTARYLDQVKRVVWVGGGDSMLLHEIVKYPSLELVVGLEIDQQVTRLSFKHFGTQPHWDDDRVQWWYGDAAKSLLMLPEDYFGSFDMVLVDLSETVMSMSVTHHLDIFGALALLLKPEGIIVKNELYLEKFSDIFEYTTHIHFYDIPVICSQSMVLGSYKNDMLAVTPKQHETEPNLYIKREEDIEDIYEDWHDYRRNSTGSQKHCREEGESELIITEHDKSPGVIMILEAEDATAKLQPSAQVKNLLEKALKKQGLKVTSTVESASDDAGRTRVVVICQQGYVVARTWPEHKYVAFDVHLWSSLDKHESIKQALVNAVGSPGGKSSSSYRIVAGGMWGVPKWDEDANKRGPRLTQVCDKPDTLVRDTIPSQGDVDAILEHSMTLVQEDNAVVVVVCGKEGEACPSLDVLGKMLGTNVKKVIPLYTCPDINPDQKLEDNVIHSCEKDLYYVQLRDNLGDDRIRVVVLDPGAPYATAQLVHRVFNFKNQRESVFAEDIAFIATMVDEAETWRRAFLDRVRHDFVRYEPVFRAQVFFNTTDSSLEMGITSSGDLKFVQHLKDATARIEEATGRVSDTRNIQNGLFNFMEDFVPSQFFLPSAYNQTSPLEQYMSQKPLGFQTVFQLEIQWKPQFIVGDRVEANYRSEGEWFVGTVTASHQDGTYNVHYDDGDKEDHVQTANIRKLHADGRDKPSDEELSPSAAQVLQAFKYTLDHVQSEDTSIAKINAFDDFGDGSVLVALWAGGTAVVLWDGKLHLDLNLFTYRESVDTANDFSKYFMSQIPYLQVALRDEQPRGYGRVVNFRKDLKGGEKPHWTIGMD